MRPPVTITCSKHQPSTVALAPELSHVTSTPRWLWRKHYFSHLSARPPILPVESLQLLLCTCCYFGDLLVGTPGNGKAGVLFPAAISSATWHSVHAVSSVAHSQCCHSCHCTCMARAKLIINGNLLHTVYMVVLYLRLHVAMAIHMVSPDFVIWKLTARPCV